jgi:hypothetical protein
MGQRQISPLDPFDPVGRAFFRMIVRRGTASEDDKNDNRKQNKLINDIFSHNSNLYFVRKKKGSISAKNIAARADKK